MTHQETAATRHHDGRTDLEDRERAMTTPGDVIAGNEFMHRELLALLQKA